MNRYMTFLMCTALALLVLLGFTGWATPTAQAALPPRPTLTPTPAPLPSQARILLRTGSGYESAWTVVQWQGADGIWHDVTGWRGHAQDGQVRWRVAEKDFGTAPFRWAVYDKQDGALLAFSAAFTLPTSGSEQVVVTLKNE